MNSQRHNRDHISKLLKIKGKGPGVYLMKSAAGAVLYIGKARDLGKRLSSYSRQIGEGQTKTGQMLNHVQAIETILTETEKEALILEASLIKKYRPKYNVILRDDKNYPYIKVTVHEKWPRLVMTRRRRKDGARYFGPFSSSSAMWKTINYLNRLFPLRRCKQKSLKKTSRPCLNYQMERCLAPCNGSVDKAHYQEMVRDVILVLEGKNRQLVKELKAKMQKASQSLMFEKAGQYRDRLAAIEKTLEKQVVVSSHYLDQDIISMVRHAADAAVSFLFVREGVITGQDVYFLQDPMGQDADVLGAVIEGYYSDDRLMPREIIIPFPLFNQALYEEWLTELRKGRVELKVPVRGVRKHLLQMAEKNAQQLLLERRSKIENQEKLNTALQEVLGLSKVPKRIDCLDISNIGGAMAVGALVCFENGSKVQSRYRHYKIRTVTGPDDYAMMEEVLKRRYGKDTGDHEGPDLLLLDGGKGQLNKAVQVLSSVGLQETIDIASIAKGKEGEADRVFRPGRKNPLKLSKNSAILHMLMRIRDESHRYGITFHRKLRKKNTLRSLLEEVPGIGPVRKKNLLIFFGSLNNIKKADVKTLSQVPGIGQETAEQIWQYIHE